MTEKQWCPTCGSDDPEVHKLSNAFASPSEYPEDKLCPDPWHSAEDARAVTLIRCLECGAVPVGGHNMREGVPWSDPHCTVETPDGSTSEHGPTQEVTFLPESICREAEARAEKATERWRHVLDRAEKAEAEMKRMDTENDEIWAELEARAEAAEHRSSLIRAACEGADPDFRLFADLILGVLDDPIPRKDDT